MTDFRRVTDSLSVAPQIALDDVARAASEGFVLLINNRPDGESPDQPTSAEMGEAAEAAGLGYLYIPVSGGPTQAQAEMMREAVAQAGGATLAFCRSGNRSISTWAVGQALAGGDRGDLIHTAAEAGYDLRPLLGG